jgi:hypothetical protein
MVVVLGCSFLFQFDLSNSEKQRTNRACIGHATRVEARAFLPRSVKMRSKSSRLTTSKEERSFFSESFL